jgi:hypothetical protein
MPYVKMLESSGGKRNRANRTDAHPGEQEEEQRRIESDRLEQRRRNGDAVGAAADGAITAGPQA